MKLFARRRGVKTADDAAGLNRGAADAPEGADAGRGAAAWLHPSVGRQQVLRRRAGLGVVRERAGVDLHDRDRPRVVGEHRGLDRRRRPLAGRGREVPAGPADGGQGGGQQRQQAVEVVADARPLLGLQLGQPPGGQPQPPQRLRPRRVVNLVAVVGEEVVQMPPRSGGATIVR